MDNRKERITILYLFKSLSVHCEFPLFTSVMQAVRAAWGNCCSNGNRSSSVLNILHSRYRRIVGRIRLSSKRGSNIWIASIIGGWGQGIQITLMKTRRHVLQIDLLSVGQIVVPIWIQRRAAAASLLWIWSIFNLEFELKSRCLNILFKALRRPLRSQSLNFLFDQQSPVPRRRLKKNQILSSRWT